jgi:hypothetical protein
MVSEPILTSDLKDSKQIPNRRFDHMHRRIDTPEKWLECIFTGSPLFLLPYLFFLLIIILILAPFSSIQASTGSIKLSWYPTTVPDLAGYKLHYGTSSQNYTDVINLGNVTSYELSVLEPGHTYYIAVTAYDISGLESGYSNEVKITLVNSVDTSIDPSGKPNSFANPYGIYIWQDTDDLEWHLRTTYSPNGFQDNYKGTTISPVSGKITQARYYSPDWSGESITWDATLIYVDNMSVNGTGGRDGIDFLIDGSEVNFNIVFSGPISSENIYIGAQLAHPTSTSFTLVGLPAIESLFFQSSSPMENHSLIFPLIVSGNRLSTTISLINNGIYQVNITMDLYNDNGTLLETLPKEVYLGPGETVNGSLADFFAHATYGIFWVKVESNEEIEGYETITLEAKSNFPSPLTLHPSPIATYQLPAIPSGTNIIYFPLVISNREWQTILSILNPNDEEASVVLTAYDRENHPLAEASGISPLRKDSLSIKYVDEYFTGSLPADTAWIKLESNKKIIGVEVIASRDNQEVYVFPAEPLAFLP